MSDKNRNLTVGLHNIEFLFQPSKLVTRILSITHKVEIGVVTSFCVNSDHIDLIIYCSIGCRKLLGIETIHQKLLQSRLVKPYFPVVGKEWDNGVSWVKILGVDYRTKVMITFKRECSPLV